MDRTHPEMSLYVELHRYLVTKRGVIRGVKQCLPKTEHVLTCPNILLAKEFCARRRACYL